MVPGGFFFMVIQGSRVVFQAPRSVFMVFTVFTVFMVFKVPSWFFMVTGGFLWLFKVPGWFFKVPGRFS